MISHPQLAVLIFAVIVIVAIVCFFLFTARGKAIEAKAQADVDQLHAKVDAVHARISNLIAEVRGLKITTGSAGTPSPAASAPQTGPAPGGGAPTSGQV